MGRVARVSRVSSISKSLAVLAAALALAGASFAADTTTQKLMPAATQSNTTHKSTPAKAAAPARSDATTAMKAAATETAPEASAASLLGEDVKGDNWEVAPAVRSDGFLYLFHVKTTYGEFQVNGLRRMKERIHELRALQVLEKMSSSERFADALTRAGLAPVRFTRDLLLDPVETTGNLVSGVGKMFNSIYAGVKNGGAGRDPLLESVAGVSKARRELAAELDVDPYTDFTPLREGLNDVAKVMAAGDLSVTAALSAVPGGAGIAVGATSTASTVAASIEDKTASEILALVGDKLEGMGVGKADAEAFTSNTLYTPADLYAITVSLESLKAQNPTAFIARANAVANVDAAKFTRYRAELLARDAEALGKLREFALASDIALNRDESGRLVAAFPLDGIYWTETVASSLTRLSNDDRTANRPRAFASTGTFSPRAETELRKLGWSVMRLP